VPWRAQALIYPIERFAEFNIFVTDELYSPDRTSWVAELASRMTDNVPAGAFVYRYDEGDVRLRVVRTFREGEAITPEAIVSLLETTAFPIKLWQRAFSYRHDPALGPQDALEIALVAEEVDDGSGLSVAATRAILRLETAPEDAFDSGQPSEPAIPTVLKLVGVENEGSDNGEPEQAAVLTANLTSAAPPVEESVFSRVMNTRIAQEVRKPEGQVAAIIVFNRDVTEADANELLFLLSDYCESTNIQEFEPLYGRPAMWFA
jgi:hypothetical protein